jgi:hypothetical protein
LALSSVTKAMLKSSHSRRSRDCLASLHIAKRLECGAFTAALRFARRLRRERRSPPVPLPTYIRNRQGNDCSGNENRETVPLTIIPLTVWPVARPDLNASTSAPLPPRSKTLKRISTQRR